MLPLPPRHGRVIAQQGLQQPHPGGWKCLGSVLSIKSSFGEALGLPGFVTKEAGMLPACSEGVRLFPGVLRAAGRHLCGLQCSTVAFFYPATGRTRLKDAARGHRTGERPPCRMDRDWGVSVLRSMSQQCHRLQGRGRKRLLFTGENAAAATSNHSSAAALAFFHWL